MFDKLYKKIVEEEEEDMDIFKASTPEEGERRIIEYGKIIIKELVDKGIAKLNSDGSYDINGHIDMHSMDLTKIPVKFNKVSGDFYFYNNLLTSLEGAPKEVGRDFYCACNCLTNLIGAPEKVGRSFYCDQNKLTSLVGSPEKVNGVFYCNHNKLTNLKGAPKEVRGRFDCSVNKKQFTKEEVRTVCDVKGRIYV